MLAFAHFCHRRYLHNNRNFEVAEMVAAMNCEWCGHFFCEDDNYLPCCSISCLDKLAKAEHEQAKWNKGFNGEEGAVCDPL